MRAPRPAPAPYTPKRALNSGSSAGAAAALGIQNLRAKRSIRFLFCVSDRVSRRHSARPVRAPRCFHFAYRACHVRTKLYGILVCLVQLVCRGILQASLIYLCGFHLWGSIFMGAYFAFKGTVLGVCASAIYASGGARALVVYWLLNCLPELVLSAFMLWLAHSSCRVSQSLSSIVFSGCRCALTGAIRRLSVHYLLCLLGCAVSSFMFSASAVLFASVLL